MEAIILKDKDGKNFTLYKDSNNKWWGFNGVYPYFNK